MRRLVPALLLAAALPLPAADAALPPLRAYVVERVSANASLPELRGGAGVGDGQYAYAAIATATAGDDDRFDDADGALFYGIQADSDPTVTSPAGPVHCSDVPVGGSACVNGMAGGVFVFVIWWEEAAFDRIVVAMRGTNQKLELAPGVHGWTLTPWNGNVREVATSVVTASATPYGAGSFVDAEAPGGPGGSVAIGHPPCAQVAYAGGGAGAVRLLGGTEEVVGNCPATFAPPAAAAPGSTEWTLTGAAAGVDDVPVRMVVIEAPVRR